MAISTLIISYPAGWVVEEPVEIDRVVNLALRQRRAAPAFKSQGKGAQRTRMNAVLRIYMEARHGQR